MVTTTMQIWKDRSNKYKTANWYSEPEVDKIIEKCLSAKINVEKFQKTGIMHCPLCGTEFIKIDKYTFKPYCSCFKKNLKVSVG